MDELINQIADKVAYRVIEFLSNQPAQNQPEEDLPNLNVPEAAIITGLSKSTIYSKVSCGDIPYYKPGKCLKFRKSELLDYISKSKG